MARTINQAEARGIAEGFFARSGIETGAIRQQLNPLSVSSKNEAPFYVFNADDNNGFVIVAGDDRLGQVLGYADSGSFSLDGAPDGLRSLMELYAAYTQNASSTPDLQPDVDRAGEPAMQPLLGDIAWGQDKPFNTLCPTYSASGTATNYYTGCVVTAATQIMKFYNYPMTGTGSKSYIFGGATLSADFGSTTYDWDNMAAAVPENPSAEITSAYSTLAYHFGVAVEMQYAQEGSGTYTMLVPAALKDYFGYDMGLKMHPREYYNSREWLQMIKSELDAGRPVYYGASSDSGNGGHAFVCDGYDSNDYIHINWGWYGRSNGYFLINHLDPSSLGEGGGTGGYNRSQEIITGIRPAQQGSARSYSLYGATRLSGVDYTTQLTLMGFVENIDTKAVNGQVGGLLMKDGEIVKVLGTEPFNIDGFANGRSGSVSVYMRSISTEAQGIADGDGYTVKMGVLPEGESEWIVLRHPIGLPAYLNASVRDGRVVLGDTHQPAPSVTLLQPIAADGDIYANGSALLTLALRNNSSDYRISKIAVRLTSVDNKDESYDMTHDVNIYDLSTETISLLMEMPDGIKPGDYYVTAFDPAYPDNVFDDTDAGRARLTVFAASDMPVLRTVGTSSWQTADGSQNVGEGEALYIIAPFRNYGPAGSASVIARLTDTDNPERSYIFMQQNKVVAKSEAFTLTFYRKAMLDAGTYSISYSLINADGQETPLAVNPDESTVTIAESETPDIDVVSFDMPETIYLSERKPYTLTVRARKAFSGTVYVRVRQYTNTSGEIVTMKSGVKLAAGEELPIAFNYRPGVEAGRYMVIVESRPTGASMGNEIPAGNIDAYYRELTVSDLSGIGSVEADGNSNGSISVELSGAILQVSAPAEVSSIMVYDIAGRCVASASGVSEINIGMLRSGVYVARISTAAGSKAFKFIK